jgi:hypothetical protein
LRRLINLRSICSAGWLWASNSVRLPVKLSIFASSL